MKVWVLFYTRHQSLQHAEIPHPPHVGDEVQATIQHVWKRGDNGYATELIGSFREHIDFDTIIQYSGGTVLTHARLYGYDGIRYVAGEPDMAGDSKQTQIYTCAEIAERVKRRTQE